MRPHDRDEHTEIHSGVKFLYHRRRGCRERDIEDIMNQKQALWEMGEYPD